MFILAGNAVQLGRSRCPQKTEYAYLLVVYFSLFFWTSFIGGKSVAMALYVPTAVQENSIYELNDWLYLISNSIVISWNRSSRLFAFSLLYTVT